jgi:hypothetical protein
LLGVCAWAATTIKTSGAAQPILDIRMLHSYLTEYLFRNVDLHYIPSESEILVSASDSLGTLETLALKLQSSRLVASRRLK